MRKPIIRSGVVAVGLLVCAIGVGADEGGGPVVYQTANIHDFPGMTTDLGGAATLLRSRQAVDVRLATSGLDINAAYTVWWIVFNNPSACTGGCGADDLGNPATAASAFYAAGFVTGMDGTANLSAHLSAGRLPQGIDVLLGSGLMAGNGHRAEIHLIIRSHGPIIPGRVDEQIGSFNGACDVNVCTDQQAVGFPAVS